MNKKCINLRTYLTLLKFHMEVSVNAERYDFRTANKPIWHFGTNFLLRKMNEITKLIKNCYVGPY